MTIDFESPGDSDTGTAAVLTTGVARRSATLEDQTAGNDITVSYDPVDVTTDPVDLDEAVVATPPGDKVSVVARATSADNGAKDVHTLYANRNLFTTEVGSPNGTLLTVPTACTGTISTTHFSATGIDSTYGSSKTCWPIPPTIMVIPQ